MTTAHQRFVHLHAHRERHERAFNPVAPAGSHSHTESVNPDNRVSRERIQYDAKASALVGRDVLEARYWDVHNFTDEARDWDYGDWHHAVTGNGDNSDSLKYCIQAGASSGSVRSNSVTLSERTREQDFASPRQVLQPP